MQIKSTHINALTSKMIKQENFGIGDVGMIVEIMRNKMYKNPIIAICREIISNSRDAHREIGTPEIPVEVIFPNDFNNNIIFKDTGFGISPDRMSNVFIMYAASTKRGDNIQTGGFGLGAKSPMSYTDNYSVTTITKDRELTYNETMDLLISKWTSGIESTRKDSLNFGRIKRTYIAYIDETNVGKIALSSEEPTLEPTGTSIIIPIKQGDRYKFIEATIEATTHWDVRPTLLGINPVPEYPTFDILVKADKWALLLPKKDRYGNLSATGSIAVIDGIKYDLDLYSIKSLCSYEQRNLFSHGFILYFDVGELTLAASRDNIHYDEDTKAVIMSRLSSILDEAPELLSNHFQNQTSYIEACRLFRNLKKGYVSELFKDTKWQGIPLRNSLSTTDIGRWCKVNSYVKDYNQISSRRKGNHILFLDKPSDTFIFHNDEDKKTVRKLLIKHLFDEHPDLKTVQVLFTPTSPADPEYIKASMNGAMNKPEYNFELMGLVGVKKLSDVKIPVAKLQADKQKRPYQKKDKNIVSGYSLTTNYHDIFRHQQDLDKDQEGIYCNVDCKTNEYSTEDLKINSENLSLFSKFIDKTIFAFTKVKEKHLEGDWITLKEAVNQAIADKNQEITAVELNVLCLESYHLFDYKMNDLQFLREPEYLNQLDKNGMLYKFIIESEKVSQNIDKYGKYMSILRHLNMGEFIYCNSYWDSKYHQDDSSSLLKLHELIMKQYSLLNMLKPQNYLDKQSIIDYINMVDKTKTKTNGKSLITSSSEEDINLSCLVNEQLQTTNNSAMVS